MYIVALQKVSKLRNTRCVMSLSGCIVQHDDMQTLKVKKIIVHRMYDPNTINNDIALLKLQKKIDFKKFGGTVAPICLPEVLKGVKPGEKVNLVCALIV